MDQLYWLETLTCSWFVEVFVIDTIFIIKTWLRRADNCFISFNDGHSIQRRGRIASVQDEQNRSILASTVCINQNYLKSDKNLFDGRRLVSWNRKYLSKLILTYAPPLIIREPRCSLASAHSSIMRWYLYRNVYTKITKYLQGLNSFRKHSDLFLPGSAHRLTLLLLDLDAASQEVFNFS